MNNTNNIFQIAQDLHNDIGLIKVRFKKVLNPLPQKVKVQVSKGFIKDHLKLGQMSLRTMAVMNILSVD